MHIFNTLKALFSPPVFQGDEEKSRDAKLLHQITLAVWVILLLAGIIALVDTSVRASALQAIVPVAVTLMVVMVLNRLGRLRLASQIMVGIVLLLFIYGNSVSAGEPRPILLLTIIAVLISGLLLGPRGAMAAAIILVLQNTVIIALSMKGLIVPQDKQASPMEYIVVNGVAYLLIGFLFSLALQRIQFSISQLQASNHELQELSTLLEQRVADRTKEMENLQAITSKRADELESVAEIATKASQAKSIEALLQAVVDGAKEAYHLYHAHIYLLDDTKSELVLTSGAGEVGQRMVSEQRSILLDHPHSLVARAARTNKGAISNDVTTEPDFLPNPLLPNTKAEMAIPVSIKDEVLGVLDVQADYVNRFTEEDVAIKTTLAQQVATSIQNIRSYERAETARQDAQSLIDNAPEAVIAVDLITGLFTEPNENAIKLYGLPREELVKVGPAQMSPPQQPDGRDSTQAAMEKIGEAMQGHKPVFEWMHRNGQGQDIPCEIRLVRMPGEKPRVRASVTDITERKRQQDLTTMRARQQEAINLITQKIQSTTSIEEAMQVAARELGHALGQKQTVVSLEVASIKDHS